MRSGFVGRLALALLATCVVAAALYWTFLRNDQSAAQMNGLRVELDVARLVNGPAPSHFDTGQPAVMFQTPDATAKMIVKDGQLTFAPTAGGAAGAFYASPDLSGTIGEIGAQWVFDPGTGASGGSISLVVAQGTQPQTGAVVPPFPVQLVVTPINWNLSVKKDDASPAEPIAAGNFDPPLQVDGSTVHEVRASIDGSRIVVDLPDGENRSVDDARVAQWTGDCAAFGLYSNDGAADSVGGFRKIWATARGAAA